MAHMAAQAAAIGVVGAQLLHVEEAALRQRRIHRCTRVALGEDQPVTVSHLGFSRIDVQHTGIEGRHDLRQGEDRADVAAAGDMGHFQAMAADQPGQHPRIGGINGLTVKGRMGLFGVGHAAFFPFSSAIFLALPNTPPMVSKNRPMSSLKDWFMAYSTRRRFFSGRMYFS